MMMEKTIPRALGRIKDIADTRHQSAQSVEKKFDKELEKRVKAYDEAMSAVPNGWNLIGMNAVEGLLNAVPNAINGVAGVIASGGSMGKMGLLYAKNVTE